MYIRMYVHTSVTPRLPRPLLIYRRLLLKNLGDVRSGAMSVTGSGLGGGR